MQFYVLILNFIKYTGELSVAKFTNEACNADGVRPSDPLIFICEIYEAFLLRVVLPTGDQEFITLGYEIDDITLPSGFTAVSLAITETDQFRGNFSITISIDSALHLKGGIITCDDTSPRKRATAGCTINIGNVSCPLITHQTVNLAKHLTCMHLHKYALYHCMLLK